MYDVCAHPRESSAYTYELQLEACRHYHQTKQSSSMSRSHLQEDATANCCIRLNEFGNSAKPDKKNLSEITTVPQKNLKPYRPQVWGLSEPHQRCCGVPSLAFDCRSLGEDTCRDMICILTYVRTYLSVGGWKDKDERESVRERDRERQRESECKIQ